MMKQTKRCIGWLLAGIMGFSPMVYADGTAGQAGAYLKIGVDARAAAMGGAYTAVADDSAAVHWNPAGLDYLERQQAAMTYTIFPEGGDFSQLLYAMPLSVFSFPADGMAGSYGQSDWGTIGIALVRYSVSTGIEARRVDSLNPDYLFSDIEGCYQLAYGVTVYPGIHTGVGVKGLYHLLEQESAHGWGVDAGLVWDAFKGLKVAMAVRDIFSQLYWTTGTIETFSADLKLGAAYELGVWQQQRLVLSVEAEKNFSDMPTRIHFGAECALFQMMFVRGGYRDGFATFGGGIQIATIGWARAGLQLDYAAQENKISGWDHWMSLKVLF